MGRTYIPQVFFNFQTQVSGNFPVSIKSIICLSFDGSEPNRVSHYFGFLLGGNEFVVVIVFTELLNEFGYFFLFPGQELSSIHSSFEKNGT